LKLGSLRKKTYAEKRNEMIEQGIIKNNQIENDFNKHNNFTQPKNSYAVLDQAMLAREKRRGHFDVRINNDLPLSTKVTKLSGDP
jgi:hypothetical protein